MRAIVTKIAEVWVSIASSNQCVKGGVEGEGKLSKKNENLDALQVHMLTL